MDSVQLAGVALAALLSENFLLVNCLGIGTQVEVWVLYTSVGAAVRRLVELGGIRCRK